MLLVMMFVFSSSVLADETEEEVSVSATIVDLGVDCTAEAAYVVNTDTGRVIYEKNATKKMYPASTTKIMACALAMELCPDLSTVITVPEDVWSEFTGMDISNAGLMGGEEMTLEDLLYCMMLPSANEAASTVAAYFGRDRFIALMNMKAQELGCVNTHFTNPHGLHDDDHYTCAYDLYLITEWAMSIPGFMDICTQSTHELAATNMHSARTIYTTVKLQDSTTGYYKSYVKGVKTGTTDESGKCLVSTATQNDMTYISVLLGCPTETDTRIWSQGSSQFTNARLIYDWCFENLEIDRLVDSDVPVKEIGLEYASDRDYLMLYTGSALDTVFNQDATEDAVITYEFDVPETVSAPIQAGDVIGTAKVYSDGQYIGDVDLVSREDIGFSYFVYVMDKISAALTSPPAYIAYALILICVGGYCYVMLVVLPKQIKAKEKAKKRRNQSGRKV